MPPTLFALPGLWDSGTYLPTLAVSPGVSLQGVTPIPLFPHFTHYRGWPEKGLSRSRAGLDPTWTSKAPEILDAHLPGLSTTRLTLLGSPRAVPETLSLSLRLGGPGS